VADWLKKFTRDRRGNTVMVFALSLLAVLMAIGGAVDFSMFLRDKNNAQDALDAAAVAIAASDETDPSIVDKIAGRVFADNLAQGTSAAVATISFNPAEKTYELTATGTYKTFLLELAGFNSLPFTVASKTIKAADGTLEVALVLDNTFSMSVPLDGSQTKLQVLQTAAQNLTDTILTNANKPYVKIGIVPYAQYINVGMSHRYETWMSVGTDSVTTETKPLPGTCTTVSTKTSCTSGTKGTCTSYKDGVPIYSSCYIVQPVCTTVAITPVTTCTKDTTKTTTTVSKWYGCINNLMSKSALVMPDPTAPYIGRMEATSSCLSPIQPLTNDASALSTTIKGLTTSSSSAETYIPSGLIWGVNLLSPPVPFSEGAAYDSANKQPRKTIVLMTDGANTQYVNSKGETAPTTSANITPAQLAATYSDEQKVCAYAKVKNIEIYTIGFGVTDATALSNLQSCATDSAHYFDAKSSADLLAAFRTIAGKLTKVRITQ
jgi:Flp pilus assembly protein TadG